MVARVRMNKLDATSYKYAFNAIFSKVKEKHPTFAVGRTLKGIIADWSDTQLQGLRGAIGEETTNNVMKGCQVRYTKQWLFHKTLKYLRYLQQPSTHVYRYISNVQSSGLVTK